MRHRLRGQEIAEWECDFLVQVSDISVRKMCVFVCVCVCVRVYVCVCVQGVTADSAAKLDVGGVD